MSKIVSYELDFNNPPKLTKEQEEELKALSEMSDSEINYSDIPPLDNNFWKKAVRNPFYKPRKIAKTLRIDADVMAFFMSKGRGYQTRINAALRETMLRSIKAS